MMITEEERVIRKSQGYDIGFEQNGKKYWINSNTWCKEKEERLFQETGLKSFKEQIGNRNLVFYDPEYFTVEYSTWLHSYLHYIGKYSRNIPQPINMSDTFWMFAKCDFLTELDLNDWDTSEVVGMDSMFFKCSSLVGLKIESWNTSKVKIMSQTFCECTSLKTLNLEHWDVSKVTDMFGMFSLCKSLYSLEIHNWRLNEASYRYGMFRGCEKLIKRYEKCYSSDKLLRKIITGKEIQSLQEFRKVDD